MNYFKSNNRKEFLCEKMISIMKLSCVLFIISLLQVTAAGFSSDITAMEKQGITVTGIVTDEDGMSIPGANIIEKGTYNGVVSDANGSFSITVSNASAVLSFSFIGYTTQEVIVGDQRILQIKLFEDSQRLEEVVVVGYGTQQKRDITGSVAVVQADDLLKATGSSALQQLQGKASGVYVATSGAPGGRSMVRIRGINTVNDNGPLYVIDGVSTMGQDLSSMNANDIESMQVLKDAASQAIYGAQAANGVILITTKKGSRTGQPVLNYSGYYGFQKTGKRYDLLNSKDRMDLEWKGQENNLKKSGLWWPDEEAERFEGVRPVHRMFTMNDDETGFVPYNFISPTAIDGKFGFDTYNPADYTFPLTAISQFSDTDWWDAISRVAPVQNHQLSLSGGSDKGMYNMSMNVYDEQSVVKHYYFKRYSTRLNTSFDIRPWLRVGENLSFSWMRDLGRNNGANESNIYSWVYRTVPYIPVYDMEGKFAGSRLPDTGNSQNALSIAYREKDNYWTNNRLFGDVWAEVDLIKGLTFGTKFGMDYGSNYYYRMNKDNPEHSESVNSNNLEEQGGFVIRWVATNTLTYKTVINKIHRLTVLAGTEAIKGGIGKQVTAQRTNFLFPDNTDTWILTMGENNDQRIANSNFRGQYAFFSIFGRVDYSLMDKYLLMVSVRRDGVSRFAPDERYGVFPAISAGWRISEEAFMAGTRTWLDDLKIRAGWGRVGNAEGPSSTNWANEFAMSSNNANYPVTGGNAANTAFRQSRIGNLGTKWEAVENINVGFDASFLRGKFGISFEYYDKTTTGMLVPSAYSNLAGDASAPYINFGDMSNKGFDISFNYRDQKGDFSWDVTATAFKYKNKVLKLSESDDTGYARWGGGDRIGNITRTTKGQEISHFYGYEVDGFYENRQQVQERRPVGQTSISDGAAENWVGRFKFKKNDPNANPGAGLGPNDRVIIGSPHPDLIASLNIGLTYKNWDLTMFWYSTIGNDLFNNTKAFTDFQMFRGNRSVRMRDQSWEPGKTNAILPMLNSGDTYSYNQVNSYYVEDASFLRLKNLVVGYTFPKEWLQKATIQNLRVYAQVENAITFTKYNGLDPELTNRDMASGGDLSRGIDGGGWPNIIRYIFGVNFTF